MKGARLARVRKIARDDRPTVERSGRDDATRARVPSPSAAIGNQALQRTLHSSRGVLARDAATELPPGLPPMRAQAARRLLSSNPQGAVDEVVAGMASRGRLDPSHFEESRIAYDAEARLPSGHFGRSSLTPGSGLPRPVRVVVGAEALRALGVLYQTIAHENRHVLELRTGAVSEAAGEVDAYIAEASQLEDSGAWRDSRYMSHLGAALRHWWTLLTEREQLAREVAHAGALEAWRLANKRRLDEQFRTQTGR